MNNEKNDIKHHLSFHKKNETPWTIKEAINILHYVGSYKQIQDKDYGIVSSSYQPFFDAVADKEGEPLMANWSSNENIGKCKKVFYEDIFPVNKNILTEDNTIRIADLEKTRMRTHINKYFQIVSDEKSCNVKNGDIVKAVEALTYLSFDNLSTGKKNFCLGSTMIVREIDIPDIIPINSEPELQPTKFNFPQLYINKDGFISGSVKYIPETFPFKIKA